MRKSYKLLNFSHEYTNILDKRLRPKRNGQNVTIFKKDRSVMRYKMVLFSILQKGLFCNDE